MGVKNEPRAIWSVTGTILKDGEAGWKWSGGNVVGISNEQLEMLDVHDDLVRVGPFWLRIVERRKTSVLARRLAKPAVYEIDATKKYLWVFPAKMSQHEMERLGHQVDNWLKSDKPFFFLNHDVRLVKVEVDDE